MNWKIRIKNPVFWVQIALGAFATALAYAGLTAADMTTWAGVWQIIKPRRQTRTACFSSPATCGRR